MVGADSFPTSLLPDTRLSDKRTLRRDSLAYEYLFINLRRVPPESFRIELLIISGGDSSGKQRIKGSGRQ